MIHSVLGVRPEVNGLGPALDSPESRLGLSALESPTRDSRGQIRWRRGGGARDVSGDVHYRDDVDEAMGQNHGAGGSNHRQPWVRSPPPSSRSLSPTNARRGTSVRAPSDENRAPTRTQLARGTTSASRKSRVESWSAGNLRRDSVESSAGPSPSTAALVLSAEQTMFSTVWLVRAIAMIRRVNGSQSAIHPLAHDTPHLSRSLFPGSPCADAPRRCNLHTCGFPSHFGQILRPQRRPRQLPPCPSKPSRFRRLHNDTNGNLRLPGISVGLVWLFIFLAILLFLVTTIFLRTSTLPYIIVFVDTTRALPLRSVRQKLVPRG